MALVSPALLPLLCFLDKINTYGKAAFLHNFFRIFHDYRTNAHKYSLLFFNLICYYP